MIKIWVKLLAVRVWNTWNTYKILSCRDWLSLRSHIWWLRDALYIWFYQGREDLSALIDIMKLPSWKAYTPTKSPCHFSASMPQEILFRFSCFVTSWQQRKPASGSLGTTYMQTGSCHSQGLGRCCKRRYWAWPALGWGEWGNIFKKDVVSNSVVLNRIGAWDKKEKSIILILSLLKLSLLFIMDFAFLFTF